MSRATMSLRLIGFNIRFATTKPFPGEEPWSVRLPKICAQLKFTTIGHDSAFLCLQEVLHSQLQDIQSCLGDAWDNIGQGRDDGKTAGEFSPVFYRSDTWTCIRNQTLWLSETPETPSRGWDAALNRVVTVGLFEHKETRASAVIMSTHFDHRGENAREESAKLLVKIAHNWHKDTGGGKDDQPAVFIGGDFNSTPDGKAYQAITQPDTGMKDIRDLVPREKRYGNDEITYTSFAGEEKQTRIDFLFTLAGVTAIAYRTFAILPNRFDDGIALSDHRTLVADVEIPLLD
ncbi:Endonuclease/exonuclease/phosphatase [Coniochaeta sp. 2T2.1]|nr:Endonuclease/exonuclease/phosphatase [Coniochaeta sp. 2T2.1]